MFQFMFGRLLICFGAAQSTCFVNVRQWTDCVVPRQRSKVAAPVIFYITLAHVREEKGAVFCPSQGQYSNRSHVSHGETGEGTRCVDDE